MRIAILGRKLMRWTILALCIANIGCAQAQSSQPPLTGNFDPGVPGVGKIVLAFLLTLAIGLALIFALRRALPLIAKLTRKPTVGPTPQVLASCNVHAGLKLHLIEINDATLVVAEGRNGIAITPLPKNKEALSATNNPLDGAHGYSQ
jgi:hypothetical protein